jgi:hypothetical protein
MFENNVEGIFSKVGLENLKISEFGIKKGLWDKEKA